jgi:predicted Zn-dependent protease
MAATAGARAAPALEARYGGVLRDAAAEERMDRLGRLVAQTAPGICADLQCRLLDTDELNAASLPGDRLYVTRGLYVRLRCDEMLAAVLAHELAHIEAGDHFRPRLRNWREAIDREVSADDRAVKYLLAAGIGPEALIAVVGLIADVQPQGWAEMRIRRLTDSTALGTAGPRILSRPL